MSEGAIGGGGRGASADHLVWIDLEMTGLDPSVDVIIEAAVLVTDGELEIVAHGPEIAVHRTEAELGVMDAWNRRTHGSSGLVERVRRSSTSVGEAEAEILEFLAEWTLEGKSPLAGNSVHKDREFIAKEMPGLDRWLHYRIVDVSTVKELCRRWYPEAAGFAKQERHRALDDIRESIDELRWYRERIFRARG